MKFILRAVALFICSLLSLSAWAVQKNYVITDHGVHTDSLQVQTKAIQLVIDKAAAEGGGEIVIPKGVFLTGALFFKPNTKLLLAEGAVLKGSDNIADFPLIPSRMEGKKLDYYAAVINAYHIEGFKITGKGTINGNGLKYWKQFWNYRDSLKQLKQVATNLDVHRPRLIFIWDCKDVEISHVRLRNAGFWTLHLYECSNVRIEGCDIRSPYLPVPAPSTDGIDLDVCKNVIVRDCYISVNDDAIAIKGGKGPEAHQLPENGSVEDILIENCSFGEAHNTLTLGSESIHANKIVMRNCKVDNNCPILNMKMRPDTYQTFENIRIEGITGKCGSILNISAWKQFFDMGSSSAKPFGKIKDITLLNINVSCNRIAVIEGNPLDQVNGILFKDMTVQASNKTLKNKYKDVRLENVVVNGSPFKLQL